MLGVCQPVVTSLCLWRTNVGVRITEQTSEEVVGEASGQSPCVKVERLTHDPSTDSEPRDGSQDAPDDDTTPSVRRHGSCQLRQLSHDRQVESYSWLDK